MESVISKLSEIKKDGLSEREFYSKVLEALDGLKENDLTPENFERLKSTLLSIGCKDVDEWVKEQRENGAPEIDTYEFGGACKGVNNASLREAVNMVSSFLRTNYEAIMATSVINPGTIYSLAKEWCDRNKMLYGPAPSMEELLGRLDSINTNVFTERGFHEEVLKCLISTRNMTEMTPDMHRQIADKLRAIGCSTVEEWKEHRNSLGKNTDMYKNTKLGVDVADIGTAVAMVEKFFTSYDDAIEMSTTVLDGDIPDALNWVNKSQEMRDAEISTRSMVQQLLRLDKNEMPERAFYTKALNIISLGINPTLSRDMHEEIKEALEQIGVKKLDEWESEEYQSPEKTVDKMYKKVNGDYRGSLSSLVGYVSAMMGDYGNARTCYEYYRREPGRQVIRESIEMSEKLGPVQAVQSSILMKMAEREEKEKTLDEIYEAKLKQASEANAAKDEEVK